jgi:Tripartite tricarboxylate transporter TctB family
MSDANASAPEHESPAAARVFTVEAVVAGLIFLLGAVVASQSWKLGAGWTSDGPGAGYFPFYIGLILCFCSLGILWQNVIGKGRDSSSFVNREELKQVASVFVPALVYVLAIVFLGIYIASAIYIALFMIVLGKYSVLKSVLLGIAINAFFFMMFEVWFKVPLYKGTLNLLGFLGY